MNAILTRTKQEQGNVLWEPFATSTPLKIAPNFAKIGTDCNNFTIGRPPPPPKRVSTSDILQDYLTDGKHLVSKKFKKNRTSTYFDPSSSSDDESNDNRKRPVIKLSAKKTRSLLSCKKTEGDAVDVGAGACHKADNRKRVKSARNKPTCVPDSKNDNVNLKRKNGEVADQDANNVTPGSEDEKILDESKPNAENKNVNHSKNDENVKKEELPKSEKKIVVKSTNKREKKLQSPRNSKPKQKKPSKKGTGTGSVLHIWDNRTDLSHQLFSDSKEQEFLNSLDLTSEDINEAIQTSVQPPWQSQKSTSVVKNRSKPEESKQERPARTKQKPREYWMPEKISLQDAFNHAKPPPSKKRNAKVSKKKTENENLIAELQQDGEESKENKKSTAGNAGGKSPKGEMQSRRKKRNTLKEKKMNSSNDAVVAGDDEKGTEVLKCSGTGVDADKGGRLTDGVAKEVAVVKEKPVADEGTVFKLLHELSFRESETGCAVVQCHSVKNFKCGVLKLKINSEFKCKTLHSNSHLGGVLVKGIIKMKIGERESELREGDMAFVPPLTEWKATNVGQSESIFYYWCGRLK